MLNSMWCSHVVISPNTNCVHIFLNWLLDAPGVFNMVWPLTPKKPASLHTPVCVWQHLKVDKTDNYKKKSLKCAFKSLKQLERRRELGLGSYLPAIGARAMGSINLVSIRVMMFIMMNHPSYH